MTRLELRLDHYIAIRDLMQDFEPETPADALTAKEVEALDLVKRIIVNIEQRRAQPYKPRVAYRKVRA